MFWKALDISLLFIQLADHNITLMYLVKKRNSTMIILLSVATEMTGKLSFPFWERISIYPMNVAVIWDFKNYKTK